MTVHSSIRHPLCVSATGHHSWFCSTPDEDGMVQESCMIPGCGYWWRHKTRVRLELGDEPVIEQSWTERPEPEKEETEVTNFRDMSHATISARHNRIEECKEEIIQVYKDCNYNMSQTSKKLEELHPGERFPASTIDYRLKKWGKHVPRQKDPYKPAVEGSGQKQATDTHHPDPPAAGFVCSVCGAPYRWDGNGKAQAVPTCRHKADPVQADQHYEAPQDLTNATILDKAIDELSGKISATRRWLQTMEDQLQMLEGAREYVRRIYSDGK